MKRIIALGLCLVMLLTCAAALAETESMGVLRVNKAFDIQYSPLPDGYKIHIYLQNDMTILANISTDQANLPGMGLGIGFSDEWADVERLNDVSEEDMQAIKDDFSVEFDDLEFETKETAYGTLLLIVKVPGGQEAYVYTIYKGHEIEIQIIPGAEQAELTDADIDRVVAFLSDMQFVPIEQ